MTNEPTIKGLGGMILLSTSLVAAVALIGRIMTNNSIQGTAREGTERGKGTPRTDAERRTRHSNLYGEDTELPPRGTGLI